MEIMGKLIQLNDYRKFDGKAYLENIRSMNVPDLLLEMMKYSEEWQKNKNNLLPDLKKKGILLFTEVYHTCQTNEMRQAALTALSELEKS